MKILLLHNRYQFAGGEDAVVEAEKNLLESNGHDVMLLEASNHDITGSLQKVNAAVSAIYSFYSKQRVIQVITEFQPNIVHVHNFFPLFSPAVYYACHQARVPVVQTLHNYRLLCLNAYLFRQGKVCEDCLGKPIPIPGIVNGCYKDSKTGSAIVAAMLSTHRTLQTWNRMVDSYIALTEFSRQKFIENNLPPEKIVVKPNFIPNPGLGNGTGNYALFVGRLSPEKGINILLKAWKLIGNKLPLKIVGEGPLSSEVIQAAKENDSIDYVGRKSPEEVYKLLQEAKFLVFPSMWYEGLPRTIIEAYATGTPVIASNLGSMSSLIKDGLTGLLFQPGNIQDLVNKIDWSLKNPEKITQMRSYARAEFEEKYTPEKNYQMLMEIYNRLILT
jgi:glycosyltransferase involved in cell wall biosynthesis